MHRQQFIDYLKSPESLNSGSQSQLENLVREYPFCQAADVLYALNLFKGNHIKYNEQLKMASAYASDRRVLKQLITSIKSTEDAGKPAPVKADQNKPDDTNLGGKEILLQDQHIIDLINQLKNEVNTLLIGASGPLATKLNQVVDQLGSLVQNDKISGEVKAEKSKKNPETLKEYSFDHLEEMSSKVSANKEKNNLIEKFIREEPRIIPGPKSAFFDPVSTAKQSIEDNDSIVTETLAEIYYKQGNLSKAIKIYKKLSLVNPQKSTYFAAQIEKIRKEIK